MCCVVAVFTLYQVSNVESNKSKCCPALPEREHGCRHAGIHANPLYELNMFHNKIIVLNMPGAMHVSGTKLVYPSQLSIPRVPWPRHAWLYNHSSSCTVPSWHLHHHRHPFAVCGLQGYDYYQPYAMQNTTPLMLLWSRCAGECTSPCSRQHPEHGSSVTVVRSASKLGNLRRPSLPSPPRKTV